MSDWSPLLGLRIVLLHGGCHSTRTVTGTGTCTCTILPVSVFSFVLFFFFAITESAVSIFCTRLNYL